MTRHLGNARLELWRALEGYAGACELDGVTRLTLEAVTGITAARRQLLTGRNSVRGSSGRHHLEVAP
jgi:hypothetical protein